VYILKKHQPCAVCRKKLVRLDNKHFTVKICLLHLQRFLNSITAGGFGSQTLLRAGAVSSPSLSEVFLYNGEGNTGVILGRGGIPF